MQRGTLASPSELRVHGVSGTAPRDMLYTDPIGPVAAPGEPLRYTTVYRKAMRDVDVDVEAFHWGGLTAGRWNTAFWILLAPFALANIAGWMAESHNKPGRIGVRLAGLGLTGVFVSQLAVVLIDLPYHWLSVRIEGIWLRLAMIALFLLFGYLYYLLIVKISAKSHFEELKRRDPVDLVLNTDPDSMLDLLEGEKADDERLWADPAGATLSDPVMWRPHSIMHRLRRLHLAAGILVVALTAARAVGPAWLEALVIGLFLAVVLLLVATSLVPTARWLRRSTAAAPVASIVAAGWALVILGFSDMPPPDHWVGVHETTFHIAILMFIGGILTLFSGLAPLGAFAIGAQLGGAMGLAVAVVFEVAIDVSEVSSQGSAWTAVAMLYLIVVLVLVAVMLTRPWDGEGLGPFPDDRDKGRSRRLMTMLRRMTVDARIVFQGAAVFAIIAGIVAVLGGCFRTGTCSPEELTAPSNGLWIGVLALSALALVWWAAHRVYGGAAILVPLGAAALVGAVILGYFSFSFLGVEIALEELVGISIAITILVPTSFIVTSLLRGFRDAERRRKVGILWDVASFFPRWYHPLAPPAYGPFVVKNLGEELERNPRRVLSAHSQGAMIALVTLGQIEKGLPGAFLTYGCQLGLHYPTNFPTLGIAELVEEVRKKLGPDRWVSLWRPNDPLGGEVDGSVVDREVDEAVGHSRYEVTGSYQRTRNELL